MMSETRHKRVLWYTRREGVVRGPYPAKQISRYILLGRIRESDEVRPDEGDWGVLQQHPDLIPEVMKLPPTDENLQKLQMARLREDERRPRDRRDDEDNVDAEVRERRQGVERRRPEPSTALRHRELKYQVSHAARRNGELYRYPLGFAVLVLLGFAASYLLGQAQPEEPPPDCAAVPRPGVNWNGCNLSGLTSPGANLIGARIRNARLEAVDLTGATMTGADLAYSSISFGNLSHADLSHASLVGVAARGADLRNVRLRDADLAYANLSDSRLDGADLSGANLGNAIWVDHKPCLAGSIGACRRAR
jgi:hypothetical protein